MSAWPQKPLQPLTVAGRPQVFAMPPRFHQQAPEKMKMISNLVKKYPQVFAKRSADASASKLAFTDFHVKLENNI